jgi:predicted permease
MAIDTVIQEFRLALRRLGQTPAFTSVTIATLALAIGANTTTFSALNQFLLRPLPVERPKELVFLNNGRNGVTQSYPNYVAFRDRNRTLDGLFAGRIQPVGLTLVDKTAYIWGYEATGNYFEVLGIRALIGRTFTPDDDRRSSPHAVLVLSYDSWQNRFAADPNIVGKRVKLNNLEYTIIGVTPKTFFGTELLLSPEFWVPMSMEPEIEPGNNWLDKPGTQNIWVAGRLKSGITARQAQDDLNSIAADRARADRVNEGLHIELSPPGLIGSALRGPVIGFASVLMALAGLVLLVACVNIAGMLLARAADRRKEISIRQALGAPRWSLIRQLLTESLVLSLAGTVAGVLIARWILGLLGALQMPINLPINTSLALDSGVLLFTVSLCFLTTLLFGLPPAVQAARVDLLPALKNQVAERFRRLQVRDLLVGAQVTLSLILLVATVLVVRSLQQAVTIDIGFNPRHAVAVAFDISVNGYSEDRAKAFEQRLRDRLATLPGIESIAIGNWLPLGAGQSNTTVYAEGKPAPPPNQAPHPYFYNVTPNYFRTMQTRLVAGRDFNDSDRPGSPLVAIINQALARRLFPNEYALGKRLRQGRDSGDWVQIIGITQDGKYQSLNDESEPAIFWPRAQRYSTFTTVIARSALPAKDVVRRIQEIVLSLDPTLSFFQAGSLEEHLNLPLMPARIAAIMLGAFGVLAVILAATGVYGMLAYAISRRTREIGIRVAIGATKTNVLSLVLRRALLIVGCASTVGGLLALAVGKFFTPVLYGVSPKDPEAYLLALALMAVIGLIACYVPARRALQIEAAVALREE